MNGTKPRLALIGCGAVAEKGLLPATKRLNWRVDVLVDRDAARARELAKRFNAQKGVASLSEIDLGQVEAAIVAVPNALHAQVCRGLLERGIHILVEKPIATTSSDCETMIAAARSSGARLAAGHIHRFCNVHRWTRRLMECGGLGLIRSLDLRVGSPFGWPLKSGGLWNHNLAGGGVLMDTGVHFLDLALWWLGDLVVEHYVDDSYGGVEADCLGHARIEGEGSAVFEFSRTRNLRNSVIIEGTNGLIEVDLIRYALLRVADVPSDFQDYYRDLAEGRQQRYEELFIEEMRDWLSAIQDQREPFVNGDEGSRAVRFIETCYQHRKSWQFPWMNMSATA